MNIVFIEKKGRRITLTSSGTLIGLKTGIPGAYQTASGLWTVPLGMESLALLRQRYGDSLKLGRRLTIWARTVMRSRAQMSSLAKSSDAKLHVLPKRAPKIYKAISNRRFQRVGIKWLTENPPAALLADDPGLGKTIQLLGMIVEGQVNGPYLVCAPKTATDTVWRREIARWLPSEHRVVVMPEYRYQRERKLDLVVQRMNDPRMATLWVIVNPSMLSVTTYIKCKKCGEYTRQLKRVQVKLACGHPRDKSKLVHKASYPQLFDIEWGAVIADEAHESLVRRSGMPTQRRKGMDMLNLRPGGRKVAITGTPLDGKPHQLWGTLNWLRPDTYSAFHRWAEIYWTKGGYTGHELGEFRRDREEMLWDSLNAIALRRTKTEVASDLPPKMEVGTPLNPTDETSPMGIWLPMADKQYEAYAAMEEESIADLDSGRLEATTALAELTRLKQLACAYGRLEMRKVNVRCYRPHSCRGYHAEWRQAYVPEVPSNKLEWILASLEEWGFPRRPLTKVVLVGFYSGVLRLFAHEIEKHFRTKPGARLCSGITGRTPMDMRRTVIDRFNKPGYEQIMVLNVKAGGTAITLDTADRMIFISRMRNPDIDAQAEDRIHRISNPRHCMYYYLSSLGTVDVGSTLIAKQSAEEVHRLMDARRGVDYVREVLNLSRI